VTLVTKMLQGTLNSLRGVVKMVETELSWLNGCLSSIFIIMWLFLSIVWFMTWENLRFIFSFTQGKATEAAAARVPVNLVIDCSVLLHQLMHVMTVLLLLKSGCTNRCVCSFWKFQKYWKSTETWNSSWKYRKSCGIQLILVGIFG